MTWMQFAEELDRPQSALRKKAPKILASACAISVSLGLAVSVALRLSGVPVAALDPAVLLYGGLAVLSLCIAARGAEMRAVAFLGLCAFPPLIMLVAVLKMIWGVVV